MRHRGSTPFETALYFMLQVPHQKEERLCQKQGYLHVAGVDEVGCGCWAGPVFAGAVILPAKIRLPKVRDSKLLSSKQRAHLAMEIKARALAWSIGIATEQEIDALNIRHASGLAMQRAVLSLSIKPDAILSDAFRVPGVDIFCKNIIKGDLKVLSIAAASIVAKVARDAFMEELDITYPGYGFGKHKGYGTKQHQLALTQLGITPIHRKSYKPIQSFIA